MHLYPKVERKKRSFKNVKKQVLPMQSMSLKEIIQRFVRKESLPIAKEGFYEDRMGDLEKMSKEDITIQHERAALLKEQISKAQKRMAKKQKDEQEKIDSEKAAAERKSGQASAASSMEEKV